MEKPRVLVTGGTGFLGQFCLPLLREDFQVDVISRHPRDGAIVGDLSSWSGGIEEIEKLKSRSYVAFLHMAGLYDLRASEQECFFNNVVGTSQALRLATRLSIPKFVGVSSIAAAVNSANEAVDPESLDFQRPFPDFYSQSKALMEQMIKNWHGGPVDRLILRPGAIVGDTQGTPIIRQDGPYRAMEAFEHFYNVIKNLPAPLFLPGKPETRLPLIPVDVCARAVRDLCIKQISGKILGTHTFHLVPKEGLHLVAFYESILRRFGIEKRIALMSDIPQGIVKKISSWTLRFPEQELHYLLQIPRYESAGTEALLGADWCPEFHSYESAFWSGYDKFISNR